MFLLQVNYALLCKSHHPIRQALESISCTGSVLFKMNVLYVCVGHYLQQQEFDPQAETVVHAFYDNRLHWFCEPPFPLCGFSLSLTLLNITMNLDTKQVRNLTNDTPVLVPTHHLTCLFMCQPSTLRTDLSHLAKCCILKCFILGFHLHLYRGASFLVS